MARVMPDETPKEPALQVKGSIKGSGISFSYDLTVQDMTVLNRWLNILGGSFQQILGVLPLNQGQQGIHIDPGHLGGAITIGPGTTGTLITGVNATAPNQVALHAIGGTMTEIAPEPIHIETPEKCDHMWRIAKTGKDEPPRMECELCGTPIIFDGRIIPEGEDDGTSKKGDSALLEQTVGGQGSQVDGQRTEGRNP